MTYIRIVGNFGRMEFCAAVLVANNSVVDTAPILRFMITWPDTKVVEYARSKGWKGQVQKTIN